MGITPMRVEFQIESMDDTLRNGLWNILLRRHFSSDSVWVKHDSRLERILRAIWDKHFKEPIDEIPIGSGTAIAVVREYFMHCQWHEVYDFVEFVAALFGSPDTSFIRSCNGVLEQELSGYRFVGSALAQITSEHEIAEIENAMRLDAPYSSVSLHIEQALVLLSDRENPDFRNSIKESISAVEAVAKAIAGSEKATLTQALNAIETASEIEMHPDLMKGFIGLYHWTSDDEGIRHSLKDKPKVGYEDASYMLATCSSFVNYLIAKAENAGVEVQPS